MTIYLQCSKLLLQLELQLKQLNLWSEIPPSPEQLNSTEPFALDTLSFEQWLQYIFIPKMTMLVNTQSQLPISINIHPMAEESFKHHYKPVGILLTTIKTIDQLINNGK